jgi:phosphodiesterase/alkaline phosphatase D-like protein
MPQVIIGHTTDDSVRIWVQGDASSRTCDVTLRAPHNGSFTQPVDLPAEHDYTATVEFGGLEPDVAYAVQATFAPSKIKVIGRARTFKHAPDAASFSFVLSSCNLSIVSINDFLALLAATAGTALADSSLDLPAYRWSARFRWARSVVRPLARFALMVTAMAIQSATSLKQSGSTYLRSPFLKISAVFDSCVLDLPLPPSRDSDNKEDAALRDRLFLAVGDRVETRQGASGVVASIADLESQRIRRVVITQIEDTFKQHAVLFRRVTADGRESLRPLGAINAVTTGRQWFEPPSFFIHAGDQIYYDFPEPERAPNRDHYRLAYREAWFEDDALRHLLAYWPHYMTLDDHEIVDQFARDFHPPNKGFFPDQYLLSATMAYRDYAQALNPLRDNDPPPICGPYWYMFHKGCTQFFVMDTRTHRRDRDGRMIDAAQMAALLGWLSKHKDTLKFVVTSVPFVAEIRERPGQRKRDWFDEQRVNDEQDKWSAQRFARQRDEIIEHVAAAGIDRLVFLTGDMHCCYHATMRIGSGPTPYESTTVHELAGGPVNQLQLASADEFIRRRKARTDGAMPVDYEVELERFHGDVSAVMHVKIAYQPRDQVIGQGRPLTPEVEWNVIRTLTDPGPEGWLRDAASPNGEPVMSGRISFAKRRLPHELQPW